MDISMTNLTPDLRLSNQARVQALDRLSDICRYIRQALQNYEGEEDPQILDNITF